MSRSSTALELTRQLIRFDTINPPGAEADCAQHLAALLEDAGFAVNFHDLAPGRPNLIARIGGNADKAPLCFTGHMDTVPLGAMPWSRDPLAGEISDGRVYGRGSSDMKSGIAAFVMAVTALAPRLASTPGVVLVLTAGEETGCEGAAGMAAAGGVLGAAGAVVVAEPTANAPFVGHKGALWLNARTRGVTAHGSMPEKGVNAVYKAARAIGKLEDFDFNVARHGVLGAPTLNVGIVHGGININSVPDQADIGIDIRTVPGQKHAPLRDQMAAYLSDEVEVSAITDVEGIWTDPDHPWIREVFAVMEDLRGERPAVSGATFFTDAAYLTPAMGGAPTVILGPGEPAMAHQTDEYCIIDRIDEAVAAYTELTRRWCGL